MAKSLKDVHALLAKAQQKLDTVILGQSDTIKELLVAILCNSNAILESVPGLGKTTLVKNVADIMQLKFSRIQSTPDLMPSDITGTLIVLENQGKQVLQFQKGPIFANVVLADEINRATPKTQSAMLEAMQERQVTVAGTTYALEQPFFVLATQNPIDQEGTYPLPEAQTDRFLLKVIIDYPSQKDENEIVNIYSKEAKSHPKLSPLLSAADVLELQKVTCQIPISKDLQNQIVELVHKTRSHKKYIKMGASPRASIGLVNAAKAHALLSGRNFASRADVITMAKPVLRHRLMLTFTAEQEERDVDSIIEELAKATIKSN
jgi:MoxR-like ATPase